MTNLKRFVADFDRWGPVLLIASQLCVVAGPLLCEAHVIGFPMAKRCIAVGAAGILVVLVGYVMDGLRRHRDGLA